METDFKNPLVLPRLRGLHIKEALPLAKSAGYTLRVCMKDGKELPVKDDTRDDRINIVIVKSVISQVIGIG